MHRLSVIKKLIIHIYICNISPVEIKHIHYSKLYGLLLQLQEAGWCTSNECGTLWLLFRKYCWHKFSRLQNILIKFRTFFSRSVLFNSPWQKLCDWSGKCWGCIKAVELYTEKFRVNQNDWMQVSQKSNRRK